MDEQPAVIRDLQERFGQGNVTPQNTRDDIPTAWVPGDRVLPILRYLKGEIPQPYRMLYDLTAVDERMRQHQCGGRRGDYTVTYHLLSLERDGLVRQQGLRRGFRKPAILYDCTPEAHRLLPKPYDAALGAVVDEVSAGEVASMIGVDNCWPTCFYTQLSTLFYIY